MCKEDTTDLTYMVVVGPFLHINCPGDGIGIRTRLRI